MPLMASMTLLNASVFALEISIIAMEAVLTPVGSPVSFARNAGLGRTYGMPFSSQSMGCAPEVLEVDVFGRITNWQFRVLRTWLLRCFFLYSLP